jgi:acetyl esterase/lipase
MPFCFVPSTISTEAQQFLATTATGANPFGAVRFGNTTADQAAAVAQLRSFFPSAFANLSAAAEAQYISSKRNTTIGGVPAVIAVPKGVQEGSPPNTKVLLYLHGGHASPAALSHRKYHPTTSSCLAHHAMC